MEMLKLRFSKLQHTFESIHTFAAEDILKWITIFRRWDIFCHKCENFRRLQVWCEGGIKIQATHKTKNIKNQNDAKIVPENA